MLRALIYILASIFLITLLRGVIGIITKGVAHLFEEQTPTRAGSPSSRGEFGGELFKCATCGTFATRQPSLTLTRDGQTLHFCSESCKSRFV
jgi:hypothetical protein